MLKAKLALLAAKNWKKIVPIALGILFFPFLIIVLMVSMTSTVTIEDDKAALYMDISEEIGNKYDVYIDYTQLVGIDAVRYAQDFSQATDATIKELAEKFVKVENEEEGTYSTKTIEEVCDVFNITLAEFYSNIDFDNLKAQEVVLLEAFRKVNAEDKEKIIEIVKIFAKNNDK